MGWRYHDLDPRLRKRVEQALHDTDKTIAQVRKECPIPWETRDDEIIRAAYNLSREHRIPLNAQKLAESLGRSVAGIYCRANELGICFERGKYPKRKPKVRLSEATMTDQERSEFRSRKSKEWHATHTHPLLGKPVTDSVREKISLANKGRKPSPESVLRGLQTRVANGTMVPNRRAGSWKSGWREVGGKRFYARSKWEANYARYLEFQKQHGLILEWKYEPKTFWFLEIKRGSRSYLPDFEVTTINGVEYHEVKGWMDRRSITKLKRMAKYYPDVPVVLKDSGWFRDNTIRLRTLIQGWEY